MRIKLTEGIAKVQKKSALRLLRKLKSELPPDGICYISGGSLRDWHHGFGCRDIDIFYHVPSDPFYKPKSFGKLETLGDYTEYYKNGNILSVSEYKCTHGALKYRPIQFICLNEDPLGVIQCDFPMNLSRIWMGVDGKIFATDEYETGYNSRIIVELDNSTWNYVYLNKILGRFSEYSFMPYGWKGRRAA